MRGVGHWYFIWVFVPLFEANVVASGTVKRVRLFIVGYSKCCDSYEADGTFAPLFEWL